MAESRENLQAPDKVTIAWLFHNVTIGGWILLGAIVAGAFAGGVTFGQTTFVTEMFGRDPSKRVIQGSQFATNEQSREIAVQIEALAKAHTARIEELNKAYLREEERAGDDGNIDSNRANHAATAKNIEEAIAEENRSFQEHVAALSVLNSPSAK